MNNQERRKLQALIRKHVAAEVALSWSGAQDPSDRKIIEQEAKDAKRACYAYLSLLVK